MKKRVFYTEAAYFLGLIVLAVATAIMEAADFGVSMVVAPAYLLHLKVSGTLPFFTFGMAEYTLQAVLLVVMMLVLRRFRISYLFSFVTAVLYGLLLDGSMLLVALVPCEALAMRIAFYAAGLLLCAFAISMFFNTYIPPEVYELFVKEVSAKYGVNIHRFKTGYDCVSCLISVALSFAFFGLWKFEGVKLGTVLCALSNGFLIGQCTKWIKKRFEFRDAWPLRKYV